MFYDQDPYRCRFDWGRHGVRQAAERGDVLVIVDTLSFSSAVATAIHHNGIIYPCSYTEDPSLIAQHIGAEVAVRRKEVPLHGRFSLSPLTYLDIEPETKVVLLSLNGATCSRYGSAVPFLFVGALLNAAAVARAVTTILSGCNLAVTVIACGERWQPSTEDGDLRFAIEDYLGAGAVLSCLHYGLSPEARLCANAFLQTQDTLAELLWDCGSGRELREKGYGEDVEHSARLNLYDSVPILCDGYLKKLL